MISQNSYFYNFYLNVLGNERIDYIMKKFSCIFVFVLVIFLPVVLFGCSEKSCAVNNYTILVDYDDENQTLFCKQTVKYTNKSANSLEEICFFLYANSFKKRETVVSKAYIEKAYPNGESYGNIEFESVSFENEKKANYEISDLGNILTVELDRSLFPDEKIEINMVYVINLANVNHRLGYGEKTTNFGNFFPIVCVYEDGKGFIKNDFSACGDPFYSDISNFSVEITCSNDYIVASSGEQFEYEMDEKKTTKCKAEKVRDFSFVLSKNFEKISKKSNKIEINYYFYDDINAEKHIELAEKVVNTFENLFGEYPYQQLSVVKTNFCFGGMEYPNLVMISDSISDEETYDYVIVHEIAHQWWYGMVGNNEYEDAWIDEGLTEFSTALFFEKNPEYNFDYEIIIQNAKDVYVNFANIFKKITGSVDESMNRNLNEFSTEPEYINCVYTKGILLFDSLRETLGEKRFLTCLKDLYKNYIYKNVSSEELIESFSKSSKRNLTQYFYAWLDGQVIIK